MTRSRRRPGPDAGITLVEILIAMTISVVLGAVIVTAIITSLNVASATTDSVASAIDVRLISTFLARDAQGAAGTDPQTVTNDSKALISVTSGDWGDCPQPGTLVARFSWVDRLTITQQRAVTVTWAVNGSTLTRNHCVAGIAQPSVVLGRSIVSASAQCTPVANCTGAPESMSLTVTGTNGRNNYSTRLSASLRPRGQDAPNESNSSLVPLLALGDGVGAACPNLALSGSSVANVIGDAVIGAECAASLSVTGTSRLNNVVGATVPMRSLRDPFATRANPCAPLPATRTYTDADGTIQPGTYSAQITMTKNVTLAAGTYCFTSTSNPALTIGATARLSGQGVTIYLVSGGLTVSPGATVNLTAPASGSNANILIRLPKENVRSVTINSGSLVNLLSGYVYAPASAVTVTGTVGTSPTAIGGVVSKSATVSNFAISRFGRIPDMAITPGTLAATAGEPYSKTLSVSNLGSDRSWSGTGLIGGLGLDSSSGEISGTPSCWGSSNVIVNVTDSTGLGTWSSIPLTVRPGITLDDPGDEVFDYAYLTAHAPAACGGATSTVTFQYAPTGTSNWATIPGCSAVVSPFVCAWDTLNPAFTNKTKYDVRAVIDSTSYYSQTYATTINNILGSDVQTTPGTPGPGQLNSGDKIEFTFTDAIKPSRIVKGWDGTARSIYFRISAGDIFKSAVPQSFAACQRNSCGVFFASNPNDCTDDGSSVGARVWDAPTVNLGVLQAASGNTFPNGGQSMWLMAATMRLEADSKTVTITLGSTLCTYWSNAGAKTSAAYTMMWYPLINHALLTVSEQSALDIDF